MARSSSLASPSSTLSAPVLQDLEANTVILLTLPTLGIRNRRAQPTNGGRFFLLRRSTVYPGRWQVPPSP
jgi:hypothetical protein